MPLTFVQSYNTLSNHSQGPGLSFRDGALTYHVWLWVPPSRAPKKERQEGRKKEKKARKEKKD